MNGRILIVEDESIIALEMKFKLEFEGYTIVGIVATGEEAIKIAHDENPDLILMDIMLRGKMDGIEAASMISAKKISLSSIWLETAT